ncbi:MAG TPA: hypothetical protein VI758_05785 [Bacteroidota bacterium]
MRKAKFLNLKFSDILSGDSPVNKNLLLILWLVLSLLILIIDYRTGPFIQFPFLFILPVMFSAWFNGKRWGYAFALGLSLCRFYFNFVWHTPWTLVESSINAVIRVSVLLLLAYLANRVAKETGSTEREVKLLEGLLPICASCKKIRDKNNEWRQLEAYIADHSEASFTHGVCPDCAKKLYGVEVKVPSK